MGRRPFGGHPLKLVLIYYVAGVVIESQGGRVGSGGEYMEERRRARSRRDRKRRRLKEKRVGRKKRRRGEGSDMTSR